MLLTAFESLVATLEVLDAKTGDLVRSIKSQSGHSDAIGCCTFSPDGKLLLSGSGDGSLKLWDLAEVLPK